MKKCPKCGKVYFADREECLECSTPSETENKQSDNLVTAKSLKKEKEGYGFLKPTSEVVMNEVGKSGNTVKKAIFGLFAGIFFVLSIFTIVTPVENIMQQIYIAVSAIFLMVGGAFMLLFGILLKD